MDTVQGFDTTSRRTVAVYDTYDAAQAHVSRLADRGFPVDHITIVGTDPVIVEQVTGKVDVWRAMMSGAMSGALLGLLFGWIFALWFAHDGTSLLAILVYWLGVGIVFGALAGVISYAFGGRRSFASQSIITARNYAVMVDERYADEAKRLMTTSEHNRTNVTN